MGNETSCEVAGLLELQKKRLGVVGMETSWRLCGNVSVGSFHNFTFNKHREKKAKDFCSRGKAEYSCHLALAIAMGLACFFATSGQSFARPRRGAHRQALLRHSHSRGALPRGQGCRALMAATLKVAPQLRKAPHAYSSRLSARPPLALLHRCFGKPPTANRQAAGDAPGPPKTVLATGPAATPLTASQFQHGRDSPIRRSLDRLQHE